jgi:hypothetical protein
MHKTPVLSMLLICILRTFASSGKAFEVDCKRYARDAIDTELGQLVLTDPVERRGCSCRLLWLYVVIQVVVYNCKIKCRCLSFIWLYTLREICLRKNQCHTGLVGPTLRENWRPSNPNVISDGKN